MDDLSVYARSLDKAKYYVYCLYDTEDKMKRPFYIGKGKSTRCLDHIKYPDDSPKSMRIKELLANKKLETIVHICTPKTNSYNKYGTMQATTMSSIVQEA